MQRTRFEHANPILRVANMARSLRYYVEVLGFRNAEWGNDDFTCVTRDGADIYLCEGDQGQPGTWVWLGVEDVAALHEEYKESGATILHPPENFPWADEMKVGDPDGHVLRFGSDRGAAVRASSPTASARHGLPIRSNQAWDEMSIRLICAVTLSLCSITVAGSQATRPVSLSEAVRAHLKNERFGIVTSVRGLPLGVRNELQQLFGSYSLDIAEPGAKFQSDDVVVNPPLPIRRLAGGIAPRGLATIDAVRNAMLSGEVKAPTNVW